MSAAQANGAVEFYGPDRAKWLGPFSDGATPDYLTGKHISSCDYVYTWLSTGCDLPHFAIYHFKRSFTSL